MHTSELAFTRVHLIILYCNIGRRYKTCVEVFRGWKHVAVATTKQPKPMGRRDPRAGQIQYVADRAVRAISPSPRVVIVCLRLVVLDGHILNQNINHFFVLWLASATKKGTRLPVEPALTT